MTDEAGAGDDAVAERYHAAFDPASEPGSDAVVATVAEATGTDPEDLEPIESVVDPIVLDALVRRRRRPIRISFFYHGYDVTLDTRGEVWLENAHEPEVSEFEVTVDVDDSASRAVIRAIAAVRGVEPTDLDPLYEAVDPEALDAMFDDAPGGSDGEISVSFRVDELQVVITSDEGVIVRPVTAGE